MFFFRYRNQWGVSLISANAIPNEEFGFTSPCRTNESLKKTPRLFGLPLLPPDQLIIAFELYSSLPTCLGFCTSFVNLKSLFLMLRMIEFLVSTWKIYAQFCLRTGIRLGTKKLSQQNQTQGKLYLSVGTSFRTSYAAERSRCSSTFKKEKSSLQFPFKTRILMAICPYLMQRN